MEKERVESDWLQAALSRHPRLDFAGRTSIDSPKVKGAKDILMFVAPKEPIGDSDRLFNFQNEVQDYIFDGPDIICQLVAHPGLLRINFRQACTPIIIFEFFFSQIKFLQKRH